jgi:hypothetical protein
MIVHRDTTIEYSVDLIDARSQWLGWWASRGVNPLRMSALEFISAGKISHEYSTGTDQAVVVWPYTFICKQNPGGSTAFPNYSYRDFCDWQEETQKLTVDLADTVYQTSLQYFLPYGAPFASYTSIVTWFRHNPHMLAEKFHLVPQRNVYNPSLLSTRLLSGLPYLG